MKSSARDRYKVSDVQYEAVSYGGGPLMVLAGPGSGKTTVITNRIRHLICEQGINPENILVVTFSRAAANEMKERFLSFGIENSQKVSFGTFHSIYFGFIKLAYGYRGEQVVTDKERYDIIYNLIREYKISTADIKTLATELLSEIALVKEDRIDINNYYSKSCSEEIFRNVYKGYEQQIGNLRKIDFEDMLLMTYDLLKEREDIRSYCSEHYRYILVDEFQDINRMQYEIVRMLAGERKNLTIVGDDDQSIYRFRGAKPEIMLGFSKDYPDACIVTLDANYRSTSPIVGAALKLIAYNKKRYDKRLYAVKEAGRAVEYTEYKDALGEADGIVNDIKDYIQIGYTYSDIAILYRTNIQSHLITSRLIGDGIPFTLQDSIPNIMEHFIAKDMLSYIKMAKGCGTRADMLRIINRPLRYIKRDALSDGYDIEDLKEYYSDTSYMLDRIDELEDDLGMLSGKDVAAAIGYIRRDIGYDSFLEEYAKEKNIDIAELMAIEDELESSGVGIEGPLEWVSKQESDRQIIEDIKKKDAGYKENYNSVKLMTFHASKGLEFKIVYIIDANERITPYHKAASEDDIEEERRMFYVAMTRAKERLNICYLKTKAHRSIDISRFVLESKGDKNERER